MSSTARPHTTIGSGYSSTQTSGTQTSGTRTSGRAVSRSWNIALWILQVLAAGAFLAAGSAKLSGNPAMVILFAQIGAGEWFRYVTGAIEVGSAILLVIPRTSFYGAALLVCTMTCAVMTHLFLVGGNPAPATALLLIVGIIAWKRWPVYGQ
jgi:putative oxidoreductase